MRVLDPPAMRPREVAAEWIAGGFQPPAATDPATAELVVMEGMHRALDAEARELWERRRELNAALGTEQALCDALWQLGDAQLTDQDRALMERVEVRLAELHEVNTRLYVLERRDAIYQQRAHELRELVEGAD